MLAGAYVVAILLPLLLTATAVGLRVSHRTPGDAPLAGAVLVPASALADDVGALRVAGSQTSSTKACPDCAETIMRSARVCRHCQFRFAPPLQGSAAV